jgi:hypothetical protein
MMQAGFMIGQERNMRLDIRIIGAFAMALALHSVAEAQVVIDMPAPKRPQVRAASSASPSSSTSVQVTLPVDIGDIALSRYASARTLPRDTYRPAYRYAGIRQYGYPYPIWWSGGFHVPHIHVHGNKFIGHVGGHHCH